MEPQTTNPIEPTKKSHRILVLVITILVTAGVIGGTTWYLMDQNAKKVKEANDKQIQELQKQIDDAKEEAEKKTESNDSTTTAAVSSKDLESKAEIQNFCLEGQSNNELRNYTYIANDNGKYVQCNVGIKDDPGHYVIGKVVNNNWQKILAGQQVIPLDIANQYKIPSAFIAQADLSGPENIYPGYKNYQY